jgi:hypothetical protein
MPSPGSKPLGQTLGYPPRVTSAPPVFGGLFLIVVAMAQNFGYRRKIPRDELLEVGVALFIFAILLGLAVSAALFIQYMQW